MKHFMLFFFLMTFSMGALSFGASIYFFKKVKNNILKYFIFFFFVITLKILLNFILLYIKINLYFESTSTILIYTVSRDISFLIIFLFPFILHRILSIPFRKAADIACGIIAGITVTVKFMPYALKILFPAQMIYFSSYQELNILLCIIFLYSSAISLLYFKKIKEKEIRNLFYMVLFFMVFVLLDTTVISWQFYFGSYDSWQYWLNILFYFLWDSFFIYYSLRHYRHKDSNILAVELSGSFIMKYNLTERETEIVRLVIQGKTNQEIADMNFISEKTVKTHIYNIYQKTGAKNRIDLAIMIKSC